MHSPKTLGESQSLRSILQTTGSCMTQSSLYLVGKGLSIYLSFTAFSATTLKDNKIPITTRFLL